MSAHKARSHPAVPPPVRSPAPPSPYGPGLLPITVMALVTALLVARPLVPGEDPGLLRARADPAGLVLTFLWLLAAAGWAGWRLWSGRGVWRGGPVEAALAVVALFFLASAAAASYRHPAWLSAWEWLVLPVAFGLIRQLAVPAADRRRLLAAVLATSVSLAGQAVYQAAVEAPARQSPGTFANPETFAGYLALLLPAAAGWAAVAWGRRPSTWQPVLAVVCAGLLAAALLLTGAWDAVAATLLIGAAVGAWYGRRLLRSRPAWGLGGLGVVLATGFLLGWLGGGQAGLARAEQGLRLRLEGWTAAWGMVRDHPWLGVGPGNFERYYPRYVPASAADVHVGDPRDFALEVAASAGVVTLAALLAALGAVGYGVATAGRSAAGSGAAEEGALPVADARDWPYYVGGMAGMLLAFLLRAQGDLAPDTIRAEAVAACGRAVVWAAAFVLFAGVPWSGWSRSLALGAGLAACLLHLTVAGGISFPSVAQPLCAVAALALGGAAAPPVRQPWASALPLLVLAGLCVTYCALVLLPVTDCAYHLRRARAAQDLWQVTARNPKKTKEAAEHAREATAWLDQARRDDPLDVVPWVESAQWDMEQAAVRKAPPDERTLRFLAEARALDPLGTDARLLGFELHLRRSAAVKDRRTEEFQAAVATADEIVAIDPSAAARLHFRLAEAYLKADDVREGHRLADLALREHRDAPGPAYRLSHAQLVTIRGWEAARLVRVQLGAVVAGAPHGPLAVLPALPLKADVLPEVRDLPAR